MEITGESLDHVLIDLYEKLLGCTSRNEGTRGATREMLGVSLRISKPRARLSRSENRGKPFSALGELLWYLAGSDDLDFIRPYVPQYSKDAVDGIIHGAYGPRLFAMRDNVDQVASVTQLLRKRPTTRRAVIQLFNAEDIASEYKEIPCTTTLQFHLRENRLHLSVTLRSNDAYWGLPHDIFCFTMLQEMIARRLSADLGEYYQYVGSMHLYEDFIEEAQQYVDEGFQKTVEMPAMPPGDPFDLVPSLLESEMRIRRGEMMIAADVMAEPYWADIIRLLQVFWASGQSERLDELRAEFVNPVYRSYLEGRRNMKPRVQARQD
jgi:thymidylate synthase